MCVCLPVCVCEYEHMCLSVYTRASALRHQKRALGRPGVRRDWEPPYLGAGTKIGPSARAANAPNLWAVSSVQILIFFFLKLIYSSIQKLTSQESLI